MREKKRIIGVGFISIGILFLLVSFFKLFPLSVPFSSPSISDKTGNPQISVFVEKDQLPPFESIFSYVSPYEKKEQKAGEYVLITTGDVLPARTVNSMMVKRNDFTFPFEKTSSFLKSADITFINLETPLLSSCQPTDEGMIFCGSAKAVEGLTFSGVDVVNLANNHSGNYGYEGGIETQKYLTENGMHVVGVGNEATLEVRGKSFGFLGFNDIGHEEKGISWAENTSVEEQIQKLRKKVEFVIVAFHFGPEYTVEPSSRQVELAHLAIDSGADLIIGNHPHWVQGVEVYKEKFISYAHGNFIFDQMWSKETREGVIGRYTFGKSGLKNIEFFPIIIENYSQPRFAERDEAEKILGKMKESSKDL
ncbi:CapA family protein [Candidatus Gottesmanbacteria bacterium]|nr:CapA family protein [Candidatus Gottesmanbacteria bacterium]